MTPPWILDAFAAAMLAVAAVSAARVAAARPWRPGRSADCIDVAHLLLGIAMSGMLTASLRTIPVGAWQSVFSVMSAWLVFRVVRVVRAGGVRALPGTHCVPCVVHCAAMLYMFLALAAPAADSGGGMAGMGAVGQPRSLALAFALLLVGYTVWDLDRLSARRTAGAGGGCRTAMGVTMAFMLIAML